MFVRPGDTLPPWRRARLCEKNGVGEQWHRDFHAGAYA